MSTTERDLLIAFLCNAKFASDIPTREELRSKAIVLGPALGVSGSEDIEHAIKEAECQRRVTIAPSMVLRSKKPHDATWINRLKKDDWNYWNSYELLMRNQRRSTNVVDEASKSTLQTLGWLQDPLIPGPWSRKGLVIGNVQSGKTANFIGLISRSADAGYRFIVVLGGTLNSLRKQTQQRLDTDFIGIVNENGRSVKAGVGKLRSDKIKVPASLTSETHDFNRMIPNQIKTDIESYGTLVVVIKKNVTTLRNLKNWLELYSQKSGSIQVPMLMIDDEADYASINTNDPARNPTAINGVIREILSMFNRNAYIGYTATPFANVFINPDSSDKMEEDNLFPEHFIQVLEPPSDYFGPQLVFPVDDNNPDEPYETSRWINLINDADDSLPLKQGKSTNLSYLPPSLRKAFKAFILTRAIRRYRGDSKRHCSMLVNISHLTRIHKQVAEMLEKDLNDLRLTVTYCHKMPDAMTASNQEWQDIKDVFHNEFRDIAESWEDILPHLRQAVDEAVVRSLHKDSIDTLDYSERAKKGEPLVVIAVGGNTLARGLTLEDLTISYLRRSTSYADTLFQMGRWFGYRPGYDDICRIWLTPDLVDWYHFITLADLDLRRQVRTMIRDNLEPKDFAIRVRSHPETLLLTAQNKMRNTAVITTRLSLAGRLREMTVLSIDKEINEHNRSEIRKFHAKLEALLGRKTGDYLSFRHIPRSLIAEFFGSFRYHPDWRDDVSLISTYNTETSDDHPEWDVIFFSGSGAESKFDLNGSILRQRTRRIELRGPKGAKTIAIPPSGDGYYLNKQRLGGKGDEGRDFNEHEHELLKTRSQGHPPVTEDYLVIRGRPVLMISLVELYHKTSTDDQGELVGDKLGIPAYSVGFPLPKDGRITKTVEFTVNQAIYQRLLGALKIDLHGEPDGDDDDDV